MCRRLCVVVLLCSFARFVLAAAPASEPNPALLYWQGIALLPALTKAQEQLPANVFAGKTAADAAEVSALLNDIRPALARFKRAAGSSAVCSWGVTLDEGPHAVLPHLPKMQLFCRLALLQAEHSFAQGNPAAGLDWILLTQCAARHLGTDGLLATVLAEYTLESQAIRAAARHLSELDPLARTAHRQRLDQLPPLHPISHGLQGERLIARWLHHMILGLENAPDREQAVAAMIQAVTEASSTPQADDTPASKPMLEVLQEWQQNGKNIEILYDRLQSASQKPWPEALADVKTLAGEPAQQHPAAQNILSLVENYLRKNFEILTQQRMLRFALSLEAEFSAGASASFRDAFFDEPLLVKTLENRWVIAMRQPVNSRELILPIGSLGTNE